MRAKQFDPDEVVSKAVAIFWSKGYEATSIQDLQEGMGIQRQSLYDTFGSKHELFLTALCFYHENMIVKNLSHLFATPTPKKDIQQVFYQRIKDAGNPKIISGCLVTNTLTELGSIDDEIKNQLKKTIAFMESAFVNAIKRAQELGEINTNKDANTLSALLVNNLQGIFVLSKAGVSLSKMRSFSKQLLTILD